ncbi:hypothetical protein GCM10007160_03990 [Litchfieldella qijiaojingensis]|uniref:Uncharacterized protein n=1 Tax=Litchfieldella qijiaojingensis TaxID=980347 RepID=A0ABQ2YDR9_9GAMM|nr:hypothetical protein [Halomonas qijiaojingensis]GGX79779.1 hypothetical protein GCM10007160_03990 [Halomonas qijiaojingensis]
MSFYLRGVLVEYGTDMLGPLPNVVVFQFNPEQLQRSLELPSSASAEDRENRGQREPHQVSSVPTETIRLTAHFDASDDLGQNDASSAMPRLFGIGPQLIALEKMTYPSGAGGGAIGAAIDAIGDALGDDSEPSQPRPREQAPRILFIWGPNRVLPVEVRSMSITEKKFDPFLNPVQAEVQIGLAIASFPENSDDVIGKGALDYTNTVKEAQVALNLVRSVELAIETIPF